MRCQRRLVFLDDFRAMAGLEEQFLLGQQVVREEPFKFPDGVEVLQFSGGI